MAPGRRLGWWQLFLVALWLHREGVYVSGPAVAAGGAGALVRYRGIFHIIKLCMRRWAILSILFKVYIYIFIAVLLPASSVLLLAQHATPAEAYQRLTLLPRGAPQSSRVLSSWSSLAGALRLVAPIVYATFDDVPFGNLL